AYASGIRKVILKDNHRLLKNFVYYYLQTDLVQQIIKTHTTGVTIKHAGKSLNYINIPIPPLPIQQKIVKILDTIQEGIDLQEKIIEKTKELKKSLMTELFRYGAPSFRRHRKLKQTEIGEIPEDWEVVKLGEVCEKPQYGMTSTSLIEKTSIKFLRITDIQEEKVDWDLVPYCNCHSEDFKKYRIEEKDILIARIGATTGKSFFAKNVTSAVFGSYLIKIKPKEKLLPEFLNCYLHTTIYWEQITYQKGGKLKGGINIPILQNLKITLPSLPEQKEIADILKVVDEKIEFERKKKGLYEELFKSLLNKIISGEIDVEKIKME
ncbi:MAG: restriction endonuclease subunit S, partial [bacterium]|nr:restriction endonuclease subunit S [bacterium]